MLIHLFGGFSEESPFAIAVSACVALSQSKRLVEFCCQMISVLKSDLLGVSMNMNSKPAIDPRLERAFKGRAKSPRASLLQWRPQTESLVRIGVCVVDIIKRSPSLEASARRKFSIGRSLPDRLVASSSAELGMSISRIVLTLPNFLGENLAYIEAFEREMFKYIPNNIICHVGRGNLPQTSLWSNPQD